MSSPDDDVKNRLLIAARSLFAKQGFEKTTVRQICREANANIALVSYYFGGKEGMFAALLDCFLPESVKNLESETDPVTGVRRIVREICLLRREQPELVAIIQQETALHTDRIGKITEYVVPIWKQLREWLREGRERGQFRYRSLDSTFSFVTSSLLFVQDNAYWSSMMEQDLPSTEAYIEDAVSFIMNALCATTSCED